MKKIYLSALLISSAMIPTAASAQGVPVVDPSNIAQTVKVVQNGVQQIQQLKAQVEQLNQLKQTIGDIGEGEMKAILDAAGLNIDDNRDSLLSQFRNTIPGIIDALPDSEVGKRLGVSTNSAQGAKTNIEEGRKFALATFFKGTNASIDDITERQGIREAALRDSATAGFSTAIVTKARLVESEATIKALSTQMTASADLRTDVQNNSAVSMASLQQLVIQNQLLAQLLEVQSTGNMASPLGTSN